MTHSVSKAAGSQLAGLRLTFCLPDFLSLCLPLCLSSWLSAWLPVMSLPVCIPGNMSVTGYYVCHLRLRLQQCADSNNLW